ncbi:hypothetical protein HCU74_11140 [Spongiibacter sp. KMU-166]|uniref:Uncharacterized protein n=1 Tax=Spongiibacter thalassae TaxID=2721624 RepID=A0ABX1GFN7_9GAMM|nr:hypothetical protein [Spongiibacter thalassae]NKI17961.1 hypothetical protein [Spongiibacter thalassae]
MPRNILRSAAIAILASSLLACNDDAEPNKINTNNASAESEASIEASQDTNPPAMTAVEQNSAPAPRQSPSPTPTKPLDLSLADDQPGGEDFANTDDGRRYQLDNLFDKSSEEEKRLKFKSKLRVKEGATLDQAMDNYSDSIDGAEMGFEYKTK